MPTSDKAARNRRVNRILLPIVGAIVLVVVVAAVLVKISEKRAEDERVQEAITSAAPPDMTDEEFAQFRDDLNEINPAIADQGARGNARNTCTSLDSDKLTQSTITRFSNADHDVTEDEAEQIVELIRDIGFCDR
ncbi:hypothetical protein [Brevibacterium oceani]|uniref:hypothetical protein n=1 Tax=Brevibacterium oceani TaxID=358099 RepID=UPI0015E74164|nr:hypothetical protein [Brevibacterium oceani]